jgi:hypothetical protein
MPRLIDDLRAAKSVTMPRFVSPFKEARWDAHAKRIIDVLRDPVPVVLIDNVADYYFTGTDQENWNLGQHFPNMAPPFEIAWFEHRLPRTIHSKECGDTRMDMLGPHARMGLLVFGTERANLRGEGLPDNLRWCLSIEMFFDYGWGDIEGPCGTWHIALDREGQIIDEPWAQTFCPDAHADKFLLGQSFMHPALLAISFLHCRNVSVVENTVPAASAKKYAARHNGVRPTEYKTLVIEPLKQILRKEGGSGEHGVPHAMHICRGHFRDYREGKGLFGKYHQVVWTPSVVRGTKGKAEEMPAREIVVKI